MKINVLWVFHGQATASRQGLVSVSLDTDPIQLTILKFRLVEGFWARKISLNVLFSNYGLMILEAKMVSKPRKKLTEMSMFALPGYY